MERKIVQHYGQILVPTFQRKLMTVGGWGGLLSDKFCFALPPQALPCRALPPHLCCPPQGRAAPSQANAQICALWLYLGLLYDSSAGLSWLNI
jgi:hypothetical protein